MCYNFNFFVINDKLSIRRHNLKLCSVLLSNLLMLRVPDDDYFRNTSCALSLISTLLLVRKYFNINMVTLIVNVHCSQY